MASKQRPENLYSLPNDYLKNILKPENEATTALSNLIEDLHNNKDATISYVVDHLEIDNILLQLFRFLESPMPIIVGNAAFIIGTLVEDKDGRSKIITLMDSDNGNKVTTLDFLVSLLSSDNAETVMNVAGTLGTLVENADGRNFVISNVECFQKLLIKINDLLTSDYLWTSSNVALILARLSIDATGNSYIANSPKLSQILNNLINCLTYDEAGRGMNAAFALGRIFDNEKTIHRFYSVLSKSQFVERLVNIIESNDLAFMKNACFCLSSIMDCNPGYELVISNHSFSRLVLLLEKILLLQDDEAIWFVVLTLKAISVRISGCKLLKKNKNIFLNINECLNNNSLSYDVKRECKEVLEYISPLSKPPVPYLTLISSREVQVSWIFPKPKNGFDLRFQLYYRHEKDEILAYRGKKCVVKLGNLEPSTKYEFYLSVSNEMETSELSDICIITTDDDFPSEPLNLNIIVVTATQVKIGWDPPEFPNGTIRHYDIHLRQSKNLFRKIIKKYLPNVGKKDKTGIEQTTDRVSIISGLQPETKYSISVFAVNSCGKSGPAEIEVMTRDSGAHAPCKLTVSVIGRSEVHLTWSSPDSPLGKIFHYDVRLNGKKTVYSGINTFCKVTGLKANTDYNFSVVAVTNVGKFESPISTKKTMKDEYQSPQRAPLYTIPSKFEMGDFKANYKSRSMSISSDQKSSCNGTNSSFDFKRRGSEYGSQKLSYRAKQGLLPIISTATCSMSSSLDLSKALPCSPKIKTSLRINDLLLPLPVSHINDSIGNFSDKSTSTLLPLFTDLHSNLSDIVP